ncbi:hypothetical protein EU538_00190 [Candidatus Thorarchaeota archaeon]|nr:MAG: hypothetical protein EU538_00190 [Candidatus Thorarchaeota archaeon]
MFEVLIAILAYGLAGLTLKVGDDLLDETDKSRSAWLPLAISGFLFGFLMSRSSWDLVLMVSILLGVLVSGKVNRPQFGIGFVTLALVLWVRGIPPIADLYQWVILLAMLFLASAVDEIGNNWADKSRLSLASLFFQYRFTLKVIALLLSIIWQEFLFAAFGIWIFDFGYEIAGRLLRDYYV